MMHRRAGEDSNHMFTLDLNSSSTTSSSSSSSSLNGYASTVAYANDYNSGSSSRGPSPPPAPRRRSHRPRGCRGGRKNRKNKQVGQGGAQSHCQQGFSSLSSSGRNPTTNSSKGILPDALFSQRQNQHFPQLGKGNLSAYQHVTTETQSWSAKTSFMAESASNSNFTLHKNNDSNSNELPVSPKKPGLQVLPPALPPFVAGKDPFLQGGGPDNSGGLKMLPSFEDSVSSETFIPSPSKGAAVAPPSPTKQQPRAESSFHSNCSNYSQQNYSRSSSSNNYYSAPATRALNSSSTTTTVADLLPSMIDNLLLDVSSNHSSSSGSSSSSCDKSLEDYHNNKNNNNNNNNYHGGSFFPMDSSVVSLSSTSASEEDDRDIHEILFGDGAGVISSLFDTSPRSFLTGGESKVPAWE